MVSVTQTLGGGFGSAVLECAARIPTQRAQIKVFGIPDRYIDHKTTREEQLSECGLDADELERYVRQLLQSTRVG
jgi:1-deoxy-D-xylulose-5-phosphate synthase